MIKRIIPESELIINPDGSVFHLHLRPDQLTDNIILVGDPGRVDMVAEFFDAKTFEVSAREFHTIGGTYNGRPIMCISHGIGPDNIDIVITELDALANVDFDTREIRDTHRTLTMVRIGTSGALQPELSIGTPVAPSPPSPTPKKTPNPPHFKVPSLHHQCRDARPVRPPSLLLGRFVGAVINHALIGFGKQNSTPV